MLQNPLQREAFGQAVTNLTETMVFSTNSFKFEKREEETLNLKRKKKTSPYFVTNNSLRNLSTRLGDSKT